jgi:hypothetical protein
MKDVRPEFYAASQLSPGDWVAFPLNTTVKETTHNSYELDADFLWLLIRVSIAV